MAATTFAPDDVRSKYKGRVVAVGGPPHSGKSVFLAELYSQLLARRPSGVFLQRACPDGEGMWSAESDPTTVADIRRKGSFSQEFMTFVLKGIENLGRKFPILLLDLGGRRTAENAEILLRSTHLIVLSSKEEEIQTWQQFAVAEGCDTLAVFQSRLVLLDGGGLDLTVRSTVEVAAMTAQGVMLNLDREVQQKHESVTFRDAISQFADWLITKTE